MHTDKVYIEVGKALSLIQFCDRVLKHLLLLVFPGKEFTDLELFQNNERQLNKATLGRLLKLLNTRVTFNDEFEALLEQYLIERNSLIHNWDEIPEWDDEDSALAFINNVQQKSAYFIQVFTSFIFEWVEQNNLNPPFEESPEIKVYIEDIMVEWKPLNRGLIKKLNYPEDG